MAARVRGLLEAHTGRGRAVRLMTGAGLFPTSLA